MFSKAMSVFFFSFWWEEPENAQRVLQEGTCGHMHGNGALLRATFMQLLVAARERDCCHWASAHHDHERCLVTTDISMCGEKVSFCYRDFFAVRLTFVMVRSNQVVWRHTLHERP
jgi:hypothetical protein